MRNLPISEIILDESVYPRTMVDPDHVFNIAEAVRIGVVFEPIVICATTRRLVDGAHRLEAYRRVRGAGGLVDAVELTYCSDAELFLDAIKRNARHGKNLTGDDRRHLSKIADTLKIDHASIGGALSVSPSLIGGLAASHAFQGGGSRQQLMSAKSRQQPIPKPTKTNEIDATALPRNRLKATRTLQGGMYQEADELALLVDDCASAIANSEIDFTKLQGGSELPRALVKLRQVINKTLSTWGK